VYVRRQVAGLAGSRLQGKRTRHRWWSVTCDCALEIMSVERERLFKEARVLGGDGPSLDWGCFSALINRFEITLEIAINCMYRGCVSDRLTKAFIRRSPTHLRTLAGRPRLVPLSLMFCSTDFAKGKHRERWTEGRRLSSGDYVIEIC
jgi:hypothetical protein